MAMGEAINSDMARILLRKMKEKEVTSSKKKNLDEMEEIVQKINSIEKSLVDVNSKDAEKSRNALIEQLLDDLIELFKKEGLSIKEQKKILSRIDENAAQSVDIFKSLKDSGLDKFSFGNFQASFNLFTSRVLKFAESIPNFIHTMSQELQTAIHSSIKSVTNVINTIKTFTVSAIKASYDVIVSQYNKLTGMVKNGYRYISGFISNVASRVYQLGSQMINAINVSFENFMMWMVSNVLTILGSIVGYIVFTIIPTMFSLMTSFFFTVIPTLFTVLTSLITGIASITAMIIPLLFVAAAILIIGLLIGYLVWEAFGSLKELYNYIFSSEFIQDVKDAFNWVWDKLEKTWNWLSENVPKFFTWVKETLWGEYLGPFWNETLKPALTWLWNWAEENIPKFIKWFEDDIWKPILQPFFSWAWDSFQKGWPIVYDWIKSIFGWVKMILDKLFGVGEWLGEKLGAQKAGEWWGNKLGFGEDSWNKDLKPMSYYKELGLKQKKEREEAKRMVNDIIKNSPLLKNIPQLSSGGVVTKPTLSMIGEGGFNEAIIPLNEEGIKFIRRALNINPNTMKNILDTVENIDKNVDHIKFEISKNVENNLIRNPKEMLIALIRPEDLEKIEQSTGKVFDFNALMKMIETSDSKILNKLNNLLEEIKNSNKTDPLLNPGTSVNDDFKNLVRALSTGILGVR